MKYWWSGLSRLVEMWAIGSHWFYFVVSNSTWHSSRSPYSKGRVWRTGSLFRESPLITLAWLKNVDKSCFELWLPEYLCLVKASERENTSMLCVWKEHIVLTGDAVETQTPELLKNALLNKNTLYSALKIIFTFPAEGVMGRNIIWAWECGYEWSALSKSHLSFPCLKF